MTKLNLISQDYHVRLEDRIQRNGHAPLVYWMTGLSGSGKSTLANALQNKLFQQGKQVYVLDGDNVRQGLNKDLDFSDAGRIENIRRIAELAKLFVDSGFIVITAFISPFASDRAQAKAIIGEDWFREIYIDTPLEICEKRDVKGLYKKARSGQISSFTGIDSPFELPERPELIIETNKSTIEQGVEQLLKLLITP